MAPRLSGLQKDVLALYRKVLREALKKDRQRFQQHTTTTSTTAAPTTPSFVSLLHRHRYHESGNSNRNSSNQQLHQTSTAYAAQEFRKQAKSVPRSDFKRIEYMIRKGEKHVKLLQMPGVKVVGSASGEGF